MSSVIPSYDFSGIQEGGSFLLPGGAWVRVTKVFPYAYNRKVFVGRYHDGRPVVVKTFRLDSVTQSPISDLTAIQAQITDYKMALRDKARIPVVADLGFNSHMFDNVARLVQLEEYAGETCSEALRDFLLEVALKLVEAILEQIVKPLFDNSTDPHRLGFLTLGIDLIPRNITYQGESASGFKVTYVDLFPSKRKIADPQGNVDYTLEFPEPTDPLVKQLGIFRSFDTAGIIVNFWMQLSRVRPDGAQVFYDLIEQFIRRSGYNQLYQLERRIDEYILNQTVKVGELSEREIAEVIGSWSFKDVFRLRLLACALAACRPGSEGLLEEVFRASHFQDKPLSPEQWQEVKELVLRMTLYPKSES